MILVDGNTIGFAMTAVAKTERQAIVGYLNNIRNLYRDHNGRRVTVLWDGRSWRFDLFPDYKANRDADPALVALKARWVKVRPIVQQFLRALGVAQMSASNMEADDLAARLTMQTVDRGHEVLLVTGDRDWLQLVDHKTTWFDPIRRRTATLANFAEIAEFDTPWQFINAKALMGDRGDNIPGVGGIGPVTARAIFRSFGSVQGMLNDYALGKVKTLPKVLHDFISSTDKLTLYERNLLLVYLRHGKAPAIHDPQPMTGPCDLALLRRLSEGLSITDILHREAAFVGPFLPHTKEKAA